MKRKWGWWMLGFVYLTTLILTAPASLLNRLMSTASGGRALLANSHGTIWHGAATPVLRKHDNSLIALNVLSWDVDVYTFFTGRLNVALNWEDIGQTQPINVSISTDTVEIRHAYLMLPASLLGELSDFLKPAQLHGVMVLRSDTLSITQNGILGLGTADWLNAGSLLSNISPLGNYRIAFSGGTNRIDLSLNTTSGLLRLEGQGHFSIADGLDFRGTAQAKKESENELRDLLNHLGPELMPGVRTIVLTQRAN